VILRFAETAKPSRAGCKLRRHRSVDPYGQTKAGFEVSGKINRKEFGLKWDAVTEAGNLVVSDEVKLVLSVQFVKEEE
jgi:polyisoprenoid-binding protein YceI